MSLFPRGRLRSICRLLSAAGVLALALPAAGGAGGSGGSGGSGDWGRSRPLTIPPAPPPLGSYKVPPSEMKPLSGKRTSPNSAEGAASAKRADAEGQPRGQRSDQKLPDVLQKAGINEHLKARVDPDLTFVNEQGKKVRLGKYLTGDKPVLLTLGYYDCPMLCDRIWNNVATMIGKMSWTPGDEYKIITVSIDPGEGPQEARDQQRQLMSRIDKQGAHQGWHFLTGDKPQIQQLAKTVGFGYQYLPAKDQYAHPSVLMVLSGRGQLMRYLKGLRSSPSTLRLSLVEASKGKAGSLLDKIVLYCCTYDPETGAYTYIVMNIMRLAGLVTVLVLGGGIGLLFVRERRKKKRRRAAEEAPDGEMTGGYPTA